MTYKSTEKKSLWWRMFACVIAAAMALSLVPAAGMNVAFAEIADSISIEGANVSIEGTFIFNGEPHEPNPTVVLDGTTLTLGEDYELYYENNIELGEATVYVDGIGAYQGTVQGTFIIQSSPEPCFDDVDPGIDDVEGDWFHWSVHKAKDLKLVEGYAGTRNFGPKNQITRAQVITILWRLAKKPKTTGTNFNDVKRGTYYYNAALWAKNVGVCNGYASGNFGPNNFITREDLAVMITNYASKVAGIAYEKMETEALINSLIEWGLGDYKDVSSYALNSIVWCFSNEVMGGTEEGFIKPKDNATRAEVAVMVVHLHNLVTYRDVEK